MEANRRFRNPVSAPKSTQMLLRKSISAQSKSTAMLALPSLEIIGTDEMTIESRQWRNAVLMVAAIVVVSSTGFVEGTTDGSCAAVLCPANSICQNGKCKLICKSGYADCNGKFPDGCEVNYVEGDVANCGRCGHKCAEPKPYEFVNCVGGRCKYTDKCTAIKCATYLNADTTCTKGKCRVTCHPGYANCDGILEVGTNGCEVNLNTDVNNCGKCDRKCPMPRRYGAGPATCSKGVCG